MSNRKLVIAALLVIAFVVVLLFVVSKSVMGANSNLLLWGAVIPVAVAFLAGLKDIIELVERFWPKGDDAKPNKALRDEQYEIILNWDGQRPMREFDLSTRDLSGFVLANADLRKANLLGADLTKSKLTYANLSGTNMREAILVGAEISYANLRGADLSGADFHGGHFLYSDLTNADLTGANLEGAQLAFVKLRNAILQDVDLNNVNVVMVQYTEKTRWPDGFDPRSISTILVDENGFPVVDADGDGGE